MEDVYDAFGFGEEGPAALKGFLAYAYHSWKRPSPRYVLLLGDATYDPKDYLQTGVKNRVPPLLARTTYLWTASDPAYAALNGEDLLPDLALGRLPAQTTSTRPASSWTRSWPSRPRAGTSRGRRSSWRTIPTGPGTSRPMPTSSRPPSSPGARSRRCSSPRRAPPPGPRSPTPSTRASSLLSYVGHGSIAVWASENVWNNLDVNTLAPQAQQPVLFTMNCLNGFFHFPPLNSLAEQFVKAEGKGAVAAFSPSGLSLDAPAHVLHQALLAEIVSGRPRAPGRRRPGRPGDLRRFRRLPRAARASTTSSAIPR